MTSEQLMRQVVYINLNQSLSTSAKLLAAIHVRCCHTVSQINNKPLVKFGLTKIETIVLVTLIYILELIQIQHNKLK